MKKLNLDDICENVENDYFSHLRRVDNIYMGPRIDRDEQVQYIKELDIDLVVDLKNKGETSFNDEEAFKKNGIKYYNFPVGDLSLIDSEKLNALHEILQSADRNILIYCMSGNRVAAIFSLLQSFVYGYPKEEALLLSKRIGLTKEGLANALEMRLKEQ